MTSIIRFLLPLALLSPVIVLADQTDPQLDQLFLNLKNDSDPAGLMKAEAGIWKIWFESDDKEIDAIMQDAASAMKEGHLARAEALYSQVIKKRPQFAEGWNRRATVRFYRKNLDGSLEDIRKTLSLEPRHFGAIWGLGMILGARGDFANAITAFQRLLEIKPNARDALPRIELLKQEMAKHAV